MGSLGKRGNGVILVIVVICALHPALEKVKIIFWNIFTLICLLTSNGLVIFSNVSGWGSGSVGDVWGASVTTETTALKKEPSISSDNF